MTKIMKIMVLLVFSGLNAQDTSNDGVVSFLWSFIQAPKKTEKELQIEELEQKLEQAIQENRLYLDLIKERTNKMSDAKKDLDGLIKHYKVTREKSSKYCDEKTERDADIIAYNSFNAVKNVPGGAGLLAHVEHLTYQLKDLTRVSNDAASNLKALRKQYNELKKNNS